MFATGTPCQLGLLQELVDGAGETAAFDIREGDRRICLYRQHTPRLFRHHVEEGVELPLDRGASARVLMAFADANGALYDQIRLDRYYVSLGERDSETAAIAAPAFGPQQKSIGALGITGSRTRFQAANCKRMTRVLPKHVNALSRAIGAE